MPTIGLYVPVRDGGAPFLRCLDAIDALDPAPDLVQIVDDGSRDGSGQKARARGFKVERLSPGVGLAAARNVGWRGFDTDLVAALDADCVPAPDWLGCLSDALEGMDDRVAGVGGRLVETGDRPGDHWRRQWLAQDWGETPGQVDFLFGANSLMLREALEDAGGYDERHLSNAEDWWLGRALAERDWTVRHVPEATVEHLRRDRTASALENYWRHRFYGHREELSWVACARSAVVALRSAASMFRQDLAAGRSELLLMDVALAPLIILRDAQATWSGR